MFKPGALKNDDEEDGKLKRLQFLWEEYKYRHELCWKLIFQITVAVVIILIIPYTEPEIAKSIGDWTLALPLIALILVLFTLARLTSELRILDTIRTTYRELQFQVYCIKHPPGGIGFGWHVRLYFLGLGVMCIVEMIAIKQPKLRLGSIALIFFGIGLACLMIDLLVSFMIGLYKKKKAPDNPDKKDSDPS